MEDQRPKARCPVRAYSALHRAFEGGSYKSLEYLLKQNLDPNVRDSHGLTPLMRCCAVTNEPVALWLLRMLLKSGGDPNLTDSTGANLLGQAIRADHLAMVSLLVQSNDIDLHHRDKEGNTALHYLAFKSPQMCERVVQAIKKFHINVDVPNYDGMTPIMSACRMGNVAFARMLAIECNASVLATDARWHRNAVEWLEFRYGRPLKPSENPFEDLLRRDATREIILMPPPPIRPKRNSQSSILSDSSTRSRDDVSSTTSIALPALPALSESQLIPRRSRRLFPDLKSVASSTLKRNGPLVETHQSWERILCDAYSMYSSQICRSFRPGVMKLELPEEPSPVQEESVGPQSRTSTSFDRRSVMSGAGAKGRRRTRGNTDSGTSSGGEGSRMGSVIGFRERGHRKSRA